MKRIMTICVWKMTLSFIRVTSAEMPRWSVDWRCIIAVQHLLPLLVGGDVDSSINNLTTCNAIKSLCNALAKCIAMQQHVVDWGGAVGATLPQQGRQHQPQLALRSRSYRDLGLTVTEGVPTYFPPCVINLTLERQNVLFQHWIWPHVILKWMRHKQSVHLEIKIIVHSLLFSVWKIIVSSHISSMLFSEHYKH